jgi:5'-deoxynucleotidase YfbR-like HD superfamily hydrolase
MKHRLHYNEEIANELLDSYIKLTDFDLHSRKRRPEDAYVRCLFYKILKELNGMNDRMIAEFLESKGRKTNRASIYHAVTKVDTYYASFKRFRKFYDVYFSDQKELGIKRDRRKKIAFKETIKEIDTRQSKIGVDALEVFISNIQFDKRPEILELVKLRVKSWEWKAKNEYEIIQCSGQLDGTW